MKQIVREALKYEDVVYELLQNYNDNNDMNGFHEFLKPEDKPYTKDDLLLMLEVTEYNNWDVLEKEILILLSKLKKEL